jgi:hypothetical protein
MEKDKVVHNHRDITYLGPSRNVYRSPILIVLLGTYSIPTAKRKIFEQKKKRNLQTSIFFDAFFVLFFLKNYFAECKKKSIKMFVIEIR